MMWHMVVSPEGGIRECSIGHATLVTPSHQEDWGGRGGRGRPPKAGPLPVWCCWDELQWVALVGALGLHR